MWRVGGARRAEAKHDADFLVTHPTLCSCARTGEVLKYLVHELEARERLLPQDAGKGGWRMMQVDKTLPPDRCTGRLHQRSGELRPSWKPRKVPHSVCPCCSEPSDEHVGAGGCYEGYSECQHIKDIKAEVTGTCSGFQHWDKLNRCFGVWRSREAERGGDGRACVCAGSTSS